MRGRGLLAALMALALVPWGAEDAVRADTQTGDFNIAVDMVFENDWIIPDGNITVTGGATLTLINCNITMRDFFSIRVDPGSGLVMRNVFLRGVFSGVPNNFSCEGRLYMDNCTLYNFETWSLNSLTGDCSIIDCDFYIEGVGIEIKAGAPLLRGNRFIALGRFYPAPMVYSRNASPVIENNTFDGYQMRYDGLEVFYPDSPVIANNTFLNCSVGLGYYYVHQHAPDGTVSPPPGGAAIIDDNSFRNCLYGMVAADSPKGNGMGRSGAEPRAAKAPPAFLASRNIFEDNAEGLYVLEEAPSLVERSTFRANGVGARLDNAGGMRLENCTFVNNTIGATSSGGELYAANCTFSANDRNLAASGSAAVVEGCTFFGGENTSVALYTYYNMEAYFANNTVSGGNSTGLRVEGTAVVYNNTFRNCPFGVYRAVRQYGQGHGRDSQQPPGPEPDIAIIQGNRFENNTRGIYSEGWTDIADNDFTGSRAAVVASRYEHPADTGYDGFKDSGRFDRFDLHNNRISNNTEGLVLLFLRYYENVNNRARTVWENDFSQNGIAVDVIYSTAEFYKNTFTRDNGWAFRQVQYENNYSDNDFGGCGRVWSQELFEIYIQEAPDNDLDAPYSNYRSSANATVRVTGRSGELLLEGGTDQYGMPPPFSFDGFDFWAANLTTELVLANGTTYRAGPAAIDAWKAGKGAANQTVALVADNYYMYLYLQPVPDIQVQDFFFTKNPAVAGEYLTANFTIRNDNTYDPTNVSLQDVEVEIALDGAVVQTLTIPWLQAGGNYFGHFDWTAEPGNHTWTVTADPHGLYNDFDRENNRALLTLPINGHPEPVLEADRVQAFTGERFIFSGAGSKDDGTVAAYMFDYGDGTPAEWSANAAGVHEYARPGVYGVRLKVRDDLGLESGWSEPLLVNVTNRLPTVELRAERTDILTLEAANFTVSVSDPEDVSLTVAWDFGDGGRIGGRDMLSAAHVYANDGRFTVTARVADSDSGEATASLVVTVRNRPPIARFSASPVNGTVLTRFSFLPECSDPDGRIASYLWDMGDNSSSIVDRPFHVYARPGIYNVTLTVQDDDGVPSEPFKLAVAVWNTPPAARARLAQQSPRAGQALDFDASASFDAESSALVFRWDFGDGTTADGPSVRHSFAKPGNYTVRVRVTDSEGAVSEAVLPVFVSGPEPSGEETGWLSTAVISGILTLAGLMFLAWVLTHRPERPPPVQKPVRRVRRPKNHDYYAEKLAESRKMRAAKENSNRSLYDAMQPVREDEKRR